MKISVITICLNAEKDLILTLESIINQAGFETKNFELIVADGGSFDRSFELYEVYKPYIDKFVRIDDVGIYDAMNKCANIARGEFVIFLNAGDVFYDRNVLRRVSELYDGSSDIVYGDHIYSDGNFEERKRSDKFEKFARNIFNGNFDHVVHDLVPCHQATFTRRSAIVDHPYDLTFKICADHNFLLESFYRGKKFQYLPTMICIYQGGGFSARNFERCRFEWNACYRNFSASPISIDRYFDIKDVVFEDVSPMRGFIHKGLYPVEQLQSEVPVHRPFSWAEKEGVVYFLPSIKGGDYIEISGYNQLPDNEIIISCEDRVLLERSLKIGEFTVRLRSSLIEEGKSFIVVGGSRAVKVDDRYVTFAIFEVRPSGWAFDQLKLPAFGEIISFSRANTRLLNRMLLNGWSYIEDSHIWMDGHIGSLAIPRGINPLQMVMEVEVFGKIGTEAPVTITLNNRGSETKIIPAGQYHVLMVEVNENSWNNEGENIMSIECPDHYDKMSQRFLSLCVYSMKFV